MQTNDSTIFLTQVHCEQAVLFYRRAGLIENYDETGTIERCKDIIAEKSYTLIDINYILNIFSKKIFHFSVEEYGILFMQSDSKFSNIIESLVYDVAIFFDNIYDPTPSSIKFDPSSEGILKFIQNGELFEGKIYDEFYYMQNLIDLLNKAIWAKQNSEQKIRILEYPDGETIGLILLTDKELEEATINRYLYFL